MLKDRVREPRVRREVFRENPHIKEGCRDKLLDLDEVLLTLGLRYCN